MCEDMQVPLLAKIPLEPKLLLSCESGKCFVEAHPTTKSAEAFIEITKRIKEISVK